jgi:hypothetical protein
MEQMPPEQAPMVPMTAPVQLALAVGARPLHHFQRTAPLSLREQLQLLVHCLLRAQRMSES